MLTELTINNFAIIKKETLSFHQGLTVITGETGAGKSMAIDALSFCFGERGKLDKIGVHDKALSVEAVFDLTGLTQAKAWLSTKGLLADDTCIVRRHYDHQGKSQQYINDTRVTLSTLKTLKPLLLMIHSQQENTALLNNKNHLRLLDQYKVNTRLTTQIKTLIQQRKQLLAQQVVLLENQQKQQERMALLQYQEKELSDFGFSEMEHEYQQLDEEQKLLSNASELERVYHESADYLVNNSGSVSMSVADGLNQVIKGLSAMSSADPRLTTMVDELNGVLEVTYDTAKSLERCGDNLTFDAVRLNELNERLSQWLSFSHKYQILPENLVGYYQSIKTQLDEQSSVGQQLTQIEQELFTIEQQYSQAAEKLSLHRQTIAKQLADKMTKQIRQLNMAQATFHVVVEKTSVPQFKLSGDDHVTFQIKMNKAGHFQDVMTSVSGGELSRISLALQTMITEDNDPITLIFDEVDTGISGTTAAIVGRLLKTLAKGKQLISITHLAQVAGCGDHHLVVDKVVSDDTITTHSSYVTEEQRIDEVARMIGGEKITALGREHAKTLLCS